VDKLIDGATRDAKLQRIMDYITTAERADENVPVRLPGHEFTRLLEENRRNGITVDDSVWAKIKRCKEYHHDLWTYFSTQRLPVSGSD
jgi:3-dehydro-L-gulonate 2-dehydrogenase